MTGTGPCPQKVNSSDTSFFNDLRKKCLSTVTNLPPACPIRFHLTTVRLDVFFGVVFPKQELWGWLEPYVDEEEEFRPCPTEGSMTMGAWVRKIVRWVAFCFVFSLHKIRTGSVGVGHKSTAVYCRRCNADISSRGHSVVMREIPTGIYPSILFVAASTECSRLLSFLAVYIVCYSNCVHAFWKLSISDLGSERSG